MSKDEAKDKLLEIMEVVDDVHGDCDRCPFCNIVEDHSTGVCPFRACAELWEF